MEKIQKFVDAENYYSFDEAFDVLNRCHKEGGVKFDESVDLVVKFGLDMNKPDSMIKTFVDLPNGNGKKNKVIVFCNDVSEKELLDAGAIAVGSDDLIAEVASGKLSDFDKCIATSSIMPKLAKIAKILGPKGLMPNQKTGTVVSPAEAVKTVSLLVKGRSTLKVDKDATAKMSIGKVSFNKEQLKANLAEVFGVIKQVKPASVKATYIQNIFLSTTMGVAIKVKVNDVSSL